MFRNNIIYSPYLIKYSLFAIHICFQKCLWSGKWHSQIFYIWQPFFFTSVITYVFLVWQSCLFLQTCLKLKHYIWPQICSLHLWSLKYSLFDSNIGYCKCLQGLSHIHKYHRLCSHISSFTSMITWIFLVWLTYLCFSFITRSFGIVPTYVYIHNATAYEGLNDL